MKYEVRKGGKVYMTTDQKRCQYSAEIEKDIQEAGYDIYIDGKKQPRRRKQEVRNGK